MSMFAVLIASNGRNATQSSVLRVSLWCMHNQRQDHVVAVSKDFEVLPGISKNGMYSAITLASSSTNDVNADINIDLHNADGKSAVSSGSVTIRLALDPNFIASTAREMVGASRAITQTGDVLRKSGIITDATQRCLDMADPHWTHLLESLLKIGRAVSEVRAFVFPECQSYC